MFKKISVVFVMCILFAAVLLVGNGTLAERSNASAATPASTSLQGLTGTWHLKKGDQTRRLKGTESTDTAGQYAATVSVQILRKEGSRPHDLIIITEYEVREQYAGKGKFRTVYAGTFTGSSGSGTYHNNDGESGTFELTR